MADIRVRCPFCGQKLKGKIEERAKHRNECEKALIRQVKHDSSRL